MSCRIDYEKKKHPIRAIAVLILCALSLLAGMVLRSYLISRTAPALEAFAADIQAGEEVTKAAEAFLNRVTGLED